MERECYKKEKISSEDAYKLLGISPFDNMDWELVGENTCGNEWWNNKTGERLSQGIDQTFDFYRKV